MSKPMHDDEKLPIQIAITTGLFAAVFCLGAVAGLLLPGCASDQTSMMESAPPENENPPAFTAQQADEILPTMGQDE